MALLSRLRDLITLSRSVPQYTSNDPTNVPIVGPDGEDYSIDQANDEPLKQIGTRRVSSPLQARIKSGLPDIISSGLAAAAHQNTSGGGATDFFGALQDADSARQRKQQIELARQRQAEIDADNLAYKRAQTVATLAKPGQEERKIATGETNASTNATKAADTRQYNQGKLGIDAQGNVIRGKIGGFDVPDVTQPGGTSIIPPTLAGHPAAGIRPTPKVDLSEQQRANLEKTTAETGLVGANTGLAEARTDQVGVQKPTKADDLVAVTDAKIKIADRDHLKGAERQHFVYGTPQPATGANASHTPEDVDYWVQKVSEDSKNFGLIKNKPLQEAVASGLARGGADIHQIGQMTRDASDFAHKALGHIDTITALIDDLDKKGQLGPVMSRWNDFLAGKVGTNPEFGPLKTNLGLLNTAMGRVHGGARGGSSETMMNHFKGMLNSGTMDAATLKADMAVYKDWLTGYAGLVEGRSAPGHPAASGGNKKADPIGIR